MFREQNDSGCIKDADAAYLAAVLDIKASFVLNRSKNGKFGGSFKAHLVVTTKDVEIVDYLNSFGSETLENSGSFRVYWNYREMRSILLAASPFMRVQRQQAEAMLQFLSRDGIPDWQSERIKQLNCARRERGPNLKNRNGEQNEDVGPLP